MLTHFRYTLRRMRGQILGWGVGVALLGMLIIPFYGVFAEDQAQLMAMLESYPPEFLAFFGDVTDTSAMTTPRGFLQYYFFSMVPVLAGIFALAAGSGLLAKDEEHGRLDLIMAHPVSRTALFVGRVLALAAGSMAVVFVGWLGCAIVLQGSSMDIGAGELAMAFVPVLAQIWIYAAMALLLSMLMPAQRFALMVTGVLLAASYILSSLGKLNPNLSAVADLMPYAYYQGAAALSGLDWGSLLGLLAVGNLCVLLAWWRFAHRDIRVVGEGSWRLWFPSRR
ncbi:MAG: ABC transporter permease [Anaerolineae bacterium]|nr:ABC transporter permease [Anaerolineae bacterium]